MSLQDKTKDWTVTRASSAKRWEVQVNDRREGPQHQQEYMAKADLVQRGQDVPVTGFFTAACGDESQC